MENNNAEKITVNSTRLRGLIENIKKINFHQKITKDLTECVLLQYQDLLDEAKDFKSKKKQSTSA